MLNSGPSALSSQPWNCVLPGALNYWVARFAKAAAVLGLALTGFSAVAGSVRASAALSAALSIPYLETLSSLS
jgi:hypothetical protein